MNYKIIFFLVISSLFFTQTSLSQQVDYDKSEAVEVIDGKEYYIHTVLKKQTLFSIAKAYGVEVKDIVLVNPETMNGLKTGMELKIPKVKSVSTSNVEIVDNPPSVPVAESNQVSESKLDSTVKHIVEKGNTLYSLIRKYNISEAELKKLNPSLENGLKVGDTLIITQGLSPKESVIEFSQEEAIDDYFYHKVQPSQTLFSLTREYNVSLDSIYAFNYDLKRKGLKANSYIRIPIKVGDSLSERQKFLNDSIEGSYYIKADSSMYDVGVMLPFFLEENDSLIIKHNSGVELDVTSPDDKIILATLPTLQFYEGILMAVDSLQKKGMNIVVRTYDTKNDVKIVSNLIKRPDVKNLDILFGPPFPPTLKVANDIIKMDSVNQVALYASDTILKDNVRLSKVTPKKDKYVTALAEHIFNNYSNKNILLISKKGDLATKKKIELFRLACLNLMTDSLDSILIKDFEVDDSYKMNCKSHLDANDTNVVVLLSANQAFVSNTINKLYPLVSETIKRRNNIDIEDKSGMDIFLFGISDIKSYSNIETEFLHGLNVHVPSFSYIDYDNENVKRFILKYRKEYNTEPSKFVFQGFDVAYYYLSCLKMYGTDYNDYIEEYEVHDLLQTRFLFDREGENYGYQNQNIFILRCKDYKFVLVE